MSKRLQVILAESEYEEVRRASQARHVSVAQWVRDALVAARRHEPNTDSARKLEVVRAAAGFNFPTGDIDRMLSEIEMGYESDDRS